MVSAAARGLDWTPSRRERECRMLRLANIKSLDTQNAVLKFMFGAAGTIAALWLLFDSYRNATELRAYLGFSQV